MTAHLRLHAPLLALCISACATGRIPNTDLADTADNRSVVNFCERYRRAVEAKDARTLLTLASPDYYEDRRKDYDEASSSSCATPSATARAMEDVPALLAEMERLRGWPRAAPRWSPSGRSTRTTRTSGT
jgi:hypothetical protein